MCFFNFKMMVAFMLFLTLMCLSACSTPSHNGAAGATESKAEQGETEANMERIDLDFTVCEEGRLPNELVELIEEKKAEPFKLTFTTREYMYIVVGYGAQQRGGCSVTVNSLYRTSQAVYIDTNLIGVEGETIQIDGMTYPYVAVKCENQNLPVVYE